ncbi:hypothetical protein BMF94_2716 [Rhodotorula taiwanensis]|uniref:Uncharacterized protein n=1 Tax=Rhodotorula taiwanensis TaxID=741276 RepID=A0A2S5BBY5_9BASI|nr:hypothetical protein BMF94_2716 [Rhodotorula taiwanensis]
MSSDQATRVEQTLLALVANLTTDANPWLHIRDATESATFPVMPPSAFQQLYALSALLGFCGILAIISLLWRFKKGVFWVFRVKRDPFMICPHIVISWSLGVVLMSIFFEVYLALVLQYFRRNFNPNFAYWYYSVWFFPFLSGSLAVWALAVSFIAHRQAVTQKPLRRAAIACNIFGPGVPIAHFAVLLGLALPSGRIYRDLVHVHKTFVTALEEHALGWRPGNRLDAADVQWAVPLVVSEVATYARFSRGFARVFVYYGVTAVLLVLAMVTVAGLYFWNIRRSLDQARRASVASAADSMERPIASITEQQRLVRRTLLNLFCAFFLFAVLGLVFSVSAIVAAANPNALTDSAQSAQVLTFLPLFGFAVLGTPCMVLVLLSAKRAAPSPTRSRETRKPSFASVLPAPALDQDLHLDEWASDETAKPDLALTGLGGSDPPSPPRRFGRWFRRPDQSDRVASSVSYTVDVDVVVEEEFVMKPGATG